MNEILTAKEVASQAQAGGAVRGGQKKRGWNGSPFMISAVFGRSF